MKITIREFFDRFGDYKHCQIVGLNPWCLNEGTDPNDEITINEDQARKLNISNHEYLMRSKSR